MPIIKNGLEVVAEYEASGAINQSGLKEIMLNGIQSFLANRLALQTTEKWFEDKDHFLIGKAADCKMSFDPTVYDTLYHTSELTEKPSDTMMKVLHMTLDQLKDHREIHPLQHPDYARLIHYQLDNVEVKDSKTNEWKTGFYMNRRKDDWREDKRMDYVYVPECVTYWADIVRGRGKQVLTVKEKDLVNTITSNWLTHPYTAHLFPDYPHIIRMYQVPVYFTVNGIACKGLIDKLDIDTQAYTITPYDFKTMKGYTLTFPSIVRKRRYDIQGCFYGEGIYQNIGLLSEKLGIDLRGFKIKNMHNIVESTTAPGLPLVYEMHDSLMYVGRRGDDKLSGFEQLIDEYAYWANHSFVIENALAVSSTPGLLTVDSQFNLVKP